MTRLSNKMKTALLCAALSPLFLSACVTPGVSRPAVTQQAPTPLQEAQITALLENAINEFNTPGAALGIVYKGQVIYSGGSGFADLQSQRPVTAQTQFRIASTTKAFTAAALAILVDEGVISWDDRVADIVPEFALYDPWVTKEFTITDLLTHRSGLGIGAGDMMLWPEPSGFTREEITRALRHFKPQSSFRSEYAYDNLLYIVAGEVVAAASGQDWESFVQSRILNPASMPCYTALPASQLSQTAIPYSYLDGSNVEVSRNKISETVLVWNAAGGLVCNADGMNTWMLTQLGGGKAPNGVRIFSEKQRDKMWTSQTILRVGSSERALNRTHFKTYALGWRKRDMHGYEVISHTGTLSGFQAEVTLVPELELGIVILNNGSNSAVRNSVTQSLLGHFMGQPKTDWVGYYAEQQAKARESSASEEATNDRPVSGQVTLPLSAYAGIYRDPWFGEVYITQDGEKLRFQSQKMVKLVGTLYPLESHRFTLLWDDPEYRADAYMTFERGTSGSITSAKIAHIDADGDWSFNFQDLNFAKTR